MQNKHIIAAASYNKKKVFFDDNYADIPRGVQIEVRELCKIGAEMSQGVFMIGFTDDGSIYFKAESDDDDFNFDDIGARLITDKLVKENIELIKSLQLWHALYMTAQGRGLREKLAKSGFTPSDNL